ncbi:transcriptional regulator [Leptolyngbya sp. Heron Island J]|nr:transcriptional regulator [Leptolyngbya sp. Heron Island J]
MDVSRNDEFVNRRKELKLRQQDVADALGVTTRTVQKWESGEHIPEFSPDKMADFCRLFQVDIDGLAAIFRQPPNSQ